MKRFPIWQITFPLCAISIFGIGAFAAFHMVEGRYLFDVDISPNRIKIRTDVDKRESNSTTEETTESDEGNQSNPDKSEDLTVK